MSNLDIFKSEDDLFYFESDHLALKGNKDYCDVLKTLVILSSHRERAIKDFNKVIELKKEALENPYTVLDKIQNGEDLGVPPLIEFPKLPNIDLKKYNVRVPEEELMAIYSNAVSDNLEEEIKSKASNANKKTWTSEEQKKLEELLRVFPPEPVEMRRYQKIAKALGNRTVQQVCSRVQKYFLKLYKAGLPIPGRIPKSGEKYKRSLLHKHQRHNHYLWKPTTFFPDLCVPVQMNDLDDIPGPSSSSLPPSASSTNYLLPSDYYQSMETASIKSEPEMQLDLLKRIRQEKAKEEDANYSPFSHNGFRCDYCDEEPIIGTRWHCATCNTTSIDFCTDCVLSQMYSDNCHPLTHSLITFCDESVYPAFAPSDSNTFKDENNVNGNYLMSQIENDNPQYSDTNLDKYDTDGEDTSNSDSE